MLAFIQEQCFRDIRNRCCQTVLLLQKFHKLLPKDSVRSGEKVLYTSLYICFLNCFEFLFRRHAHKLTKTSRLSGSLTTVKSI